MCMQRIKEEEQAREGLGPGQPEALDWASGTTTTKRKL